MPQKTVEPYELLSKSIGELRAEVRTLAAEVRTKPRHLGGRDLTVERDGPTYLFSGPIEKVQAFLNRIKSDDRFAGYVRAWKNAGDQLAVTLEPTLSRAQMEMFFEDTRRAGLGPAA